MSILNIIVFDEKQNYNYRLSGDVVDRASTCCVSAAMIQEVGVEYMGEESHCRRYSKISNFLEQSALGPEAVSESVYVVNLDTRVGADFLSLVQSKDGNIDRYPIVFFSTKEQNPMAWEITNPYTFVQADLTPRHTFTELALPCQESGWLLFRAVKKAWDGLKKKSLASGFFSTDRASLSQWEKETFAVARIAFGDAERPDCSLPCSLRVPFYAM